MGSVRCNDSDEDGIPRHRVTGAGPSPVLGPRVAMLASVACVGIGEKGRAVGHVQERAISSVAGAVSGRGSFAAFARIGGIASSVPGVGRAVSSLRRRLAGGIDPRVAGLESRVGRGIAALAGDRTVARRFHGCIGSSVGAGIGWCAIVVAAAKECEAGNRKGKRDGVCTHKSS